MGKHRKTSRQWGPYVTTGIALEAATLFAFAYAADAHVVPNPQLAAAASVFVDGTKSLTGNEDGVSPFRMADSFNGTYKQPDAAHDLFFDYPRSLGPLTGFGDPTYDVSEADATAKTIKAVQLAKLDPDYHPGDAIYVVGYSQGAGAVANAIPGLETPEFADDNIQFVLAANPRRNDGGILTRIPAGVYLPIFGVTFGGGTSPQSPDAKVLQVTKQYDGVGDAPAYVFNVVADVNAILGYVYLHPGYYATVDPSTTPAADRIITTSADGRITDVLIKAPVGELPLTMPLLQLGVPKSFVDALDPFLRAVIETGYNRPVGDTFPSEPVPFQLLPPPTKWLSDSQAIAAGAAQTLQALTGTTPQTPNPMVTNNQNVVTALVAPASDPPPVKLAKRSPEVTSAAVDDPAMTPTPTPPPAGPVPPVAKPAPSPHKFEPLQRSKSGWKPGDLLRSLINPKPDPSGTPTASTNSTTPPGSTAEDQGASAGTSSGSAPTSNG